MPTALCKMPCGSPCSMKEEFCYFCGEEIGELFWLILRDEVGKNFINHPKIVKICDDPLCFGKELYGMSTENPLWEKALKEYNLMLSP